MAPNDPPAGQDRPWFIPSIWAHPLCSFPLPYPQMCSFLGLSFPGEVLVLLFCSALGPAWTALSEQAETKPWCGSWWNVTKINTNFLPSECFSWNCFKCDLLTLKDWMKVRANLFFRGCGVKENSLSLLICIWTINFHHSSFNLNY